MESAGTRALIRRFVPLLVVAAGIVLVVSLLPKSGPTVRPAAPPQRWHVLTQQWSTMVVGDPANPYLVQLRSMTDRWLAADGQVTVVQKNGEVRPYSQDGDAKWEAAGKPTTAPQVGANHSVRIGPMQQAVQKTNYAEFQMSPYNQMRFDALDALPADPVELKKALETIVGPNLPQRDLAYRIATLAMGMMAANVRDDQRRAAFELLKHLDGVRTLDELPLREGGVTGVAIPAPPTFQFGDVETQLMIRAETGLPYIRQDVTTTPRYGLPAGMPISGEEYLLLDRTDIDPIVPQDVPVNGEVESPIIER